MTDRRRAAGRRVRQVASTLRSRGKLASAGRSALISRVTGELAGLAETTAAQAAMVLRNGRRAVPHALSGRMRGRLRRSRRGCHRPDGVLPVGGAPPAAPRA
jgi:hypothetical protein